MKNERNNFCKNLKKWQSEENAKLKENCHKKKFFLTKRTTGIFFLAIIKWKILNENYSEFF